MKKVKLFWDPEGFELDSLGNKKLLRITDGDTPFVSMSIRMLSIDAPEMHYPGRQHPSKSDAKLKELADWLKSGKAPVDSGLAAYLYPKLATGAAGSLQEQQGKKATEEFQRLLDQKLTKPNGRKRQLFLRTADQHFDDYGRLLVYISPYYTKKELSTISYKERATFNLLMVESGWAAPFPIYPSLSKYKDLVLLQEVAEDAFEHGKGVWSDPDTLTGYEFRMCHRLWTVTGDLIKGKSLSSREKYGWVERYCIDMTTREIFQPQEYYRVKPYNRIFVWPKDVNEAVGKLNLVPGD
ncbi:MAG: thermonuclease family protein [Candidatus Methanoperedens sp.]|nr:thermonuclease family protein [Candidatus Methanoperedens sp.]